MVVRGALRTTGRDRRTTASMTVRPSAIVARGQRASRARSVAAAVATTTARRRHPHVDQATRPTSWTAEERPARAPGPYKREVRDDEPSVRRRGMTEMPGRRPPASADAYAGGKPRHPSRRATKSLASVRPHSLCRHRSNDVGRSRGGRPPSSWGRSAAAPAPPDCPRSRIETSHGVIDAPTALVARPAGGASAGIGRPRRQDSTR